MSKTSIATTVLFDNGSFYLIGRVQYLICSARCFSLLLFLLFTDGAYHFEGCDELIVRRKTRNLSSISGDEICI